MINSDSLKEWIIKNNVVSRSIEYYWKYIDMYIEDVEDEYSNTLKYINLKLMSVKLRTASLTTNYEHQQDVISICLDILYINKYIGRYEIVYTLSAEYVDDFIELEDVHYIWRLADVYEKTSEIAKRALEEGAGLDFISKITGLSINQISENIE